jgi:Leucine-rich repeat (LRR) protein
MRHWQLKCNGITSIAPLGGLTALAKLDISGCECITSIAPLSGLTALTKLG